MTHFSAFLITFSKLVCDMKCDLYQLKNNIELVVSKVYLETFFSLIMFKCACYES